MSMVPTPRNVSFPRAPSCLFLILVLALAVAVPGLASEKKVGFQGTARVPGDQQASVYVEPVMLTEVYHRMGPGLQIGAVTSNQRFAAGLQKAADVWGLHLDLFMAEDAAERAELTRHLIENFEAMVIVDDLAPEVLAGLSGQAEENAVYLHHFGDLGEDAYQTGFDALKEGRADLLARIPKYDEVLPVAFPISPLPDSFFQPSKFPYPRPLVRVERTAESASASVHAHTSCTMVAQTGNMLHRTSSTDPDLFLMGMEGGNLSLKALPGAVDPEKISAVMTSWVMAIRGTDSAQRDILVENDGVETSFFKPAIHAPEELEIALEEWKKDGRIASFHRISDEELVVEDWDGSDRTFRAGMFLVASDRDMDGPELVGGVDAVGRYTLEFLSTQRFLQLLTEVRPDLASQPPSREPTGGILTAGGASVGRTVGVPLGELLKKVEHDKRPDFQPYLLSVEGGFFVVTPEVELSDEQLASKVERMDIDLRGPLTSDQTITLDLENGETVLFRRTVLNFDELDQALAVLEAQGLISDWTYDGARGRGLNANVVISHFMGKHRKFMSSLCTWPNEQKPETPTVRFYVDGMQRLNFSFIDSNGWRQEFVEVPLQVPPVPRDVELYSGIHTLD